MIMPDLWMLAMDLGNTEDENEEADANNILYAPFSNIVWRWNYLSFVPE